MYTPPAKTTYRSISWELLADGAVLPFLLKAAELRFTPKPAQRRLDSNCPGSSFELMVRLVFRSSNEARTDLPPSFSGSGSTIGWSPPPMDLGMEPAEAASIATDGTVLT